MTAARATDNPIDGAIVQLEQLVAWSLAEPSRIGYFASLYLRVTRAIRSKIGTGTFDDDARMAQLDAAFAARYLSAVAQFRRNDPALPEAWAVAFHATEQKDLIIVQHLLLAMNAHIGIDLAVAAASVSPGQSIGALHGDFIKVNAILANAVPVVITEIDALSPLLHLLADLALEAETSIIDFGLVAARSASWGLAQKLALASASDRESMIAAENKILAALSRGILEPDPIVAAVVQTVRLAEVQDIAQIIKILDGGNPLPEPPLTSPRAPVQARPGQPGAGGEKAANHVYYFDIAPGSWTGTFTFEVTSWRSLWSSPMSLQNKLLATAMHVCQKVLGDSSISSELTIDPDRGACGVASNRFRLFKSWMTLFTSNEDYVLSPDGHRVTVDAHVTFGPISFLFREHDVYPATVYDGGMRNLYHVKLLGTRFLGTYHVQSNRREVQSSLTNSWASANEVLTKG
jgi:hypothetical protein